LVVKYENEIRCQGRIFQSKIRNPKSKIETGVVAKGLVSCEKQHHPIFIAITHLPIYINTLILHRLR